MCQNRHVSVCHGEKIPRYRWFAMLRQWVSLGCWKSKLIVKIVSMERMHFGTFIPYWIAVSDGRNKQCTAHICTVWKMAKISLTTFVISAFIFPSLFICFEVSMLGKVFDYKTVYDHMNDTWLRSSNILLWK